MVAALALDEGIVAAKVIEGSFHHDTFMTYLCDAVVSLLPLAIYDPFLMFSSMSLPPILVHIVMDNSCAHHSEEIKQLVHSYGMSALHSHHYIIHVTLSISCPIH